MIDDSCQRGRKEVNEYTTKRLTGAAKLMFRQLPTKKLGNLPGIGYFFEGCEYVFVDSDGKV
jgi:hypothetical protein